MTARLHLLRSAALTSSWLEESVMAPLSVRLWRSYETAVSGQRLRGERLDGWPAHFELRRMSR